MATEHRVDEPNRLINKSQTSAPRQIKNQPTFTSAVRKHHRKPISNRSEYAWHKLKSNHCFICLETQIWIFSVTPRPTVSYSKSSNFTPPPPRRNELVSDWLKLTCS